jgi:predicted ATPase
MHFERGQETRQAVVYLQQSADTALQRRVYAEVIRHLTRGLALLNTLPPTPERAQHELLLQTALGSALITTKGEASLEVEQAFARARELCQQVEDVPLLFTALWGLRLFYVVQGALPTARELGEQLLTLAQRVQEPLLLVGAHQGLGTVLFEYGEFLSAQVHLQQGIALSRQLQRRQTSLYIRDPSMVCHAFVALTLWFLGYPEQAWQHTHEALRLAQEQADPFNLASALYWTATLAHCCRDVQEVSRRAQELIALATAHGFAHRVANGRVLSGWALSMQGQGAEALTQIHQGMTFYQATWADQFPLHQLAILAEAHGNADQAADRLRFVVEALATVNKRGEQYYQAEVYRLKGELLLRAECRVRNAALVEECFQHALAVARHQQAKSLELRAALSLARLWQRQGRRAEARHVLAPVYSWFTEGFDTADLQDARALLQEQA